MSAIVDPCQSKKRRIQSTTTPLRRSNRGKDFISTLPNELIVKVFSYLSHSDLATKVSLVSHRFRDLCQNPSLWRTLKLPTDQRLSHEQAEMLLLRCTQLNELDFCKRWNASEIILLESQLGYSRLAHLTIVALEHCPLLQVLHLPYATEVILMAIAQYGHHLRKLSCTCFGTNFLAAVPDCLTNLTTVATDSCISNRDLRAISDHCRRLEDFAFYGLHLSKDAMTHFLDATRTSLRRLAIRSPPKTSLETVDKCQLIEGLALKDCFLSSKDMEAISKLHRLTHLSIIGELQCNNLKQVFSDTNLSKLEYLKLEEPKYVSRVDNSVLETISNNCPSLDDLIMKGCAKVDASGIKHVLEKCKLRSLNLIDIAMLTDDIFANLPTPWLKTLQVKDCQKITSKALKEAEESGCDRGWLFCGDRYSFFFVMAC